MHVWRLIWAGLGFAAAKTRSYLDGRKGLLTERENVRLDRPKSGPMRLNVLKSPQAAEACATG